MRLGEQPVPDRVIYRKSEVANQDHRARGRVERAEFRTRQIAPRTIGRLESLQGLNQLEQLGRGLSEILIGAQRDERAIGRAVRNGLTAFIAAVGLPKMFD